MTVTETRGRKPATGRFVTRSELCAHVWNAYRNTKANIADISRQAKVSPTLVSRILATKEGMPAASADASEILAPGVVKTFANTRSMAAWLANEDNLVALKMDFPPARFTATLDLANMRVVVTATQRQEQKNNRAIP